MKQVIFLCAEYPDYFSGYHFPTAQIMLTNDIYTFGDIAECLRDEINQNAEYLFSEHPEHEFLYNLYINELESRSTEIFGEFPAEIYETTDEESGYTEWAYLYFSIGEPKTINGLTFCD
jgi:hypothetical protein